MCELVLEEQEQVPDCLIVMKQHYASMPIKLSEVILGKDYTFANKPWEFYFILSNTLIFLVFIIIIDLHF
jgi:hypothetical protein